MKISAINIEPTSACNLRCSICSRIPGKRLPRFMTMQLYRNILRQILDSKHCLPSTELRFFLSGEPTLHPQLATMVKLASAVGLWKTLIHTNVTVLDSDLMLELIEAKLLNLSISFDGADKQTYELVRRGADFDESLQNARMAVSYAQGTNTNVTIQSIVPAGESIEERRAAICKLFPQAKSLYIRHPHNWNAAGSVTTAKNIAYGAVCMFPSMFFPIYCNGDVPVCCADLNGDCVIANVNDESIDKIWDTKFASIRDALATKIDVPSVCQNCERYRA